MTRPLEPTPGTGEAAGMAKSDDDYPPSFWHDKAEEARALADNMVSRDGKNLMLEIAALYDKLAASSAARREAKRKRNNPDPS